MMTEDKADGNILTGRSVYASKPFAGRYIRVGENPTFLSLAGAWGVIVHLSVANTTGERL